MRIANDELNALSISLYNWFRTGKTIDEAPKEIQDKANRYKELSMEIENDNLRLMGVKV